VGEDGWDPDYYLAAPVFDPLHKPAAALASRYRQDWPNLGDYQQLFDTHAAQRHNQAGRALHFVAQGPRSKRFEDGYEARIYLQGEIQTRLHNWHDYFQVLIWCLFPRLKAALNARHYTEASKRLQTVAPQGNRGAVENALTLFDECGVIIACDDVGLLQGIRDFRWKEIFWRQRQRLQRRLSCVVFGHALYEKALSPYVGMTGQALLLKTPSAFQALSPAQQTDRLDQELARLLATTPSLSGPEFLTPFPLLGMPGWDRNNSNEAYYDNADYFRPGRRKPRAPIVTLKTLQEVPVG
jgi:hypothetical protein